ncbi:MAG TPA: cupin domain-containing protein [Thermodesulfobacteriota bacterium]|nr:cupin domain-containing protein [Thermodesulfobacteriota bacterium]
MKKYVTRLKDLAPYTPPGHSRTTNYRLLGPGPSGSERVEVVLGIIEFGGQADAHAHSSNEQGFFILEGRALVAIGEEQETVGPNDFIFLPKGTPHKVVPLEGPPLKILIFYAPPIFRGEHS